MARTKRPATVPAVDPARAHTIVTGSGCATAKVKVADHPASLPEDLARLEAVRDALGPDGAVLAYSSSIERSPNTVKAYAHDLKDWFVFLDRPALDPSVGPGHPRCGRSARPRRSKAFTLCRAVGGN